MTEEQSKLPVIRQPLLPLVAVMQVMHATTTLDDEDVLAVLINLAEGILPQLAVQAQAELRSQIDAWCVDMEGFEHVPGVIDDENDQIDGGDLFDFEDDDDDDDDDFDVVDFDEDAAGFDESDDAA